MIRLLKNKIVYSTEHYNTEYEKYVKKEVDFLHPYLNETVELSQDFTLGDLFKILEREKDFFDMVFSSHLGHFPLQLYIDDIKKPLSIPSEEDDEDELCCLELKRFGELEPDGDLNVFIDFSGLSNKTDWSYAIEFTPLNELKHLLLRLNVDFKITEVKMPDDGKPHYCQTHVEGKTVYSVYELISTVLYEISFAGGPEDRAVKICQIRGDIEELKEGLDIKELKEGLDSEDCNE